MGEGNVLTRVFPSIHDSVCPRGGGGGGGVRSSGGVSQGGGQVQLPGGVGQIQPGGGSGPAGRGGSGPAGGGGQVQLAGGGGGVRSSWWGGGSAKIEQHREYLLHGGRYASCIHAGGLSCIKDLSVLPFFFLEFLV